MRGINELIDDMIKAVNGISPSLGLGEEGEKAALLLALLKDRLKHPDGPLAVVMCGPTGAGKSHLFNFLVGEDISPSSYKRPSTVAPVLAASPETSSAVNKADFLPDYKKIATKSPISFEIGDDRRLYTAEVKTPPWGWPPELALIDAPDFDSVMEKNQSQATDMARRADAVILVAHQAKYADQSAWDFLEEEKKRDRPLLVILNRVTAEAVEADFSARLEALNIKAALLTWPEEGAAEQTPVNAARGELTRWLTGLSARSREITAENGRRETARLGELMRGEIISRLTARENELTRRLGDVRRLTAEWTANPQKHLSLNLPGEMKEALMKNLGETVRRSDLWAGPRRVISRPFALVGEQLKKLFNDDPKAASNLADDQLTSGLAEASREALVAAVRDEARMLAETAGLEASASAGLDYTPDEIRALHKELTSDMDKWLREETGKLLSGLPLGQKAAFYFVQLMHAGLVLGLQIKTGGLPGTEVLVGGALGPVISKLTGVVISRESVTAFEERAVNRHRQALAAIFKTQGDRYEQRLANEMKILKDGKMLLPGLDRLEKEARRLWN